MTTAQSPAPLILVLDIGSSSARAALYDAAAQLVPGSIVQQQSKLHMAADGTAVDDPAALLQRVVGCVDGVLAAAGSRAREIAAVGCGTYVSNVLGVAADGQPITPIFTYADTRSAEAARRLRERWDERDIWQRTGCPLRTSYLPALLSWLADDDPDTFTAVERWLSVGEWLLEQLFGRSAITSSVASWTGLLNRTSLDWDDELLALLNVRREQLGPVVDADARFDGLREPWAARWPALRDVPWFGALGDGAAANIGSGCTTAERIALSIGTTGALRTIPASVAAVPPGLWCYRVDHHMPLLGAATSEGGNVLAWALHTLRIDGAALQHHLLDPRGEHGLTVLPFVAGERAPGWAGDVLATIDGISATTGPLDIARAALEGVTYRWAHIAAALRQALDRAPTIVVSGGAIQHLPAWAQLIADALGMPVAPSRELEATCRGVALMALRSIGAVPDLEALPAAIDDVFRPDPTRHEAHQAAIERQARLYQTLHGASGLPR